MINCWSEFSSFILNIFNKVKKIKKKNGGITRKTEKKYWKKKRGKINTKGFLGNAIASLLFFHLVSRAVYRDESLLFQTHTSLSPIAGCLYLHENNNGDKFAANCWWKFNFNFTTYFFSKYFFGKYLSALRTVRFRSGWLRECWNIDEFTFCVSCRCIYCFFRRACIPSMDAEQHRWLWRF